MTRSGVTLVEVLIALAILGIAFVAYANLQVSSLRVTRDSQLASAAMQVGNLALETLGHQVLADFDAYTGCPGSGECAGEAPVSGFANYSATYSIVYENPPGLVRIDVRVEGPASMSYSQYISCVDVNPSPTVMEPDPCL